MQSPRPSRNLIAGALALAALISPLVPTIRAEPSCSLVQARWDLPLDRAVAAVDPDRMGCTASDYRNALILLSGFHGDFSGLDADVRLELSTQVSPGGTTGEAHLYGRDAHGREVLTMLAGSTAHHAFIALAGADAFGDGRVNVTGAWWNMHSVHSANLSVIVPEAWIGDEVQGVQGPAVDPYTKSDNAPSFSLFGYPWSTGTSLVFVNYSRLVSGLLSTVDGLLNEARNLLLGSGTYDPGWNPSPEEIVYLLIWRDDPTDLSKLWDTVIDAQSNPTSTNTAACGAARIVLETANSTTANTTGVSEACGDGISPYTVPVGPSSLTPTGFIEHDSCQAKTNGNSVHEAACNPQFLHGIDLTPEDAQMHGWWDLRNVFVSDYSDLNRLKYYGGECGTDEDVSSAGPNGPNDPKSHTQWLPEGHESGASGCEAPLVHSAFTNIEHLAYHFAWWVYWFYQSNPQDLHAIDLVAHSMGGLIVRYALHEVALGPDKAPGWPPYLAIEDVVTMGTPHLGSRWACPLSSYTEAREMCPGSGLLKFLNAEAQDPQGATQTDWTLIGSQCDDIVYAGSATGMSAEHKLMYLIVGGNRAPGCVGHTGYYGDAGSARDAPIEWAHMVNGEDVWSYSTKNLHAGQFAHEATERDWQ